jgi:hypothetical protein
VNIGRRRRRQPILAALGVFDRSAPVCRGRHTHRRFLGLSICHHGNAALGGLPRHSTTEFRCRILPQSVQGGAALYVAWFGPLLVATIAAWWLNRRYGRGADGLRLTSTLPVAQ